MQWTNLTGVVTCIATAEMRYNYTEGKQGNVEASQTEQVGKTVDLRVSFSNMSPF